MKLSSGAVLMSKIHLGSKHISFGADSAMNVGCYIDGTAEVHIGERVRIGPFAKILTATHPVRNSVYRRKVGERIDLPVIIERGCWIGMDAKVLPGVTIREGCVIAAGSVVTHSTEPNGLYAGVPARRKRDLSTAEDYAEAAE